MTPLFVVLGIVLVLLIWASAMYNSLVRLRNACDESWSDIDTELRRRYDLIPNLVETVKGYAAHERDVLERVVQARNAAVASRGSPASQARDENVLIDSMKRMFVTVENYPTLKADQHFLELMRELSDTEDRIARARRFYNANVRDLGNRVEVFPSNLVAGMFGFQKREFFEIEDSTVRSAVAVRL
jgi:LemA protein